ncbi:glycosyltransferase family 2 protein [Fulvivirgaceae bacterium PWU5]|uniref:Glycosyltransferase family 2 protein n=1 Tax=Dawidia cretensis TaxID=2782350 RepID=A0AAP2DYK0_9BACT|nr:glycosyltransferase family A protein [Dawidia cretensis]MBT1709585.1 glycosyltransferase family 2 protein [Dawidia cretensis]
MQPFFSVVIPVYNKAAYLRTTVASVLAQTFQSFELLLVVDKSTDDSQAIAMGFTDPRITVYNRDTPGPGGYAARNLGIEKANTGWVAFLDADDVWMPQFLQRVYDAIAAHGDISLFCSGFLVGSEQKSRPHMYYRKFETEGSHVFDLQRFLLHKPIHTSSVVIRRDLLVSSGGFPAGRFKRGGDSETWLRLMYTCQRGFWICYLGERYDNRVADSVINANKHYLEDHPVRQLVQQLLPTVHDKGMRRALKRHSNSFMFPSLRALGRQHTLSPRHFGALYYDRTLWRSSVVGMFLLSLAPGAVQRIFINALKK